MRKSFISNNDSRWLNSRSTCHYHLDHLGMPRELIDTDGRILCSARYHPYGNLALADVDAIDKPFGARELKPSGSEEKC
ncbi:MULTISPECIES: RHS domain-containing protein [unclassified Methylomonas]|uniref:RHS domain-containing protein n=1 Tax=unclassified Methylomonas TaxID=2608980 RepID=UPI0027E3C3BA|nr:RHS domain-containing protein [Methylomonas sp. LW13]